MLSKELAIYVCSNGRAVPDCLTRATHARYGVLAGELLKRYRHGTGKTRAELHRDCEAVFAGEPDCPPQRIRALLRLLDQASTYHTDAGGRSQALRIKVFEIAARYHPLVREPDGHLFQHAEHEVKQTIAAQLGSPWTDLEENLYADLPAFHRLVKPPADLAPEDLLRRYNVAQAQTLLLWAESMTVTASEDFKRIFRYAKAQGLLHDIACTGPGEYRIHFSGPASVLSHTRRYGAAMGALLPIVLCGRAWRMSARLQLPFGPAVFELSPRNRLRSYLPDPADFDSQVEQAFAEKFGPIRDGWHLQREGDILVHDQKVFVPDFSFRHEDGTLVHLEIVGFWTPEYLEAKQRTLALFRDAPIIIAAAAASAARDWCPPDQVVVYRTRLKIQPVLEKLEAFRADRVS